MLVVGEFVFVHATHRLLASLLLHLLLQELLVLSVNSLNFILKSLLLFFVVPLILRPNHGLLIVQRLLLSLLLSLLIHLLGKKSSHLFLLKAVSLSTSLLLHAGFEFSLHFVTGDLVVLCINAVPLLGNNGGGELVHEGLGTLLSSLELTDAISLLLVEHLGVLLLGQNVCLHLLLLVLLGLPLVLLVLNEHLLEILLFLASLLLLGLSLLLHVGLQTVNQLDLGLVELSGLELLSLFLFLELLVTGGFLSFDLLLEKHGFLLLALAQEFDVLLLKRFVHGLLFLLFLSSQLFLLKLAVEFLSD